MVDIRVTRRSRARNAAIQGAHELGAEVIKVAVGDRVTFPRYTGTEIRVADEDHLIIESTDLLAILREEPAVTAAA
jgi:co-chaperonin GroES (HSP10)